MPIYLTVILDLFVSFDTIIWGSYLGMILRYFGKLSKQTSHGSRCYLFSVKDHNKFSFQIIIMSSQNNVPKQTKDTNKFFDQKDNFFFSQKKHLQIENSGIVKTCN